MTLQLIYAVLAVNVWTRIIVRILDYIMFLCMGFVVIKEQETYLGETGSLQR